MAWLPAVLTVLGVVAVGLLGFFGSRLPSLESQRQDFQAILGPLREDLKDLRTRVESLEVQREEDRRRFGVAVAYIRTLLTWIDNHPPGVRPPPIPDDLRDQIPEGGM